MKPMPFTYHRPKDVDDALALLQRLGSEAKLLAGGQSLLPSMNLRLSGPSALIDISGLPELSQIEVSAEGIRIGAAVRYIDLLSSDTRDTLPLLHLALPHVANAAVRNRGTLAGSLCHSDPSAETAGALLALDAEIEVRGPSGSRRIPVDAFLRGVYETALEWDEMVISLHLPPAAPQWVWFDEHVRRRGDFANAGLAACGSISAHGTLQNVKLAFIGLGTRARLARGTMALLETQTLTPAVQAQAVAGLAEDLASADLSISASSHQCALAEDLLDRALSHCAAFPKYREDA